MVSSSGGSASASPLARDGAGVSANLMA